MLFNSKEFAVFILLTFFLYWFVFNKAVRSRNAFLLLISYAFYGWWDWRFLSLLIFSSGLDYFLAKKIYEAPSPRQKKHLLLLSLISNLGLLGAFKYFNFFSDSFVKVLNSIGFEADLVTLNVILPVGISFYTFQTLSYTIDVYRGNMKPAKDWLQFFTYVTFFPQLVAGPIERATHLLPQFNHLQKFTYEMGASGVRLMLWGFFKKVVIADNCADQVNAIFKDYANLSTPVLIMGAVFFAFQIYGDFSGYSDIARGVSRLFGIELMVNFRTPYFSRDIAEFWRRWHISLTTWFRDYVYIPMGGSKVGRSKAIYNTMVVFLLSGFWHGANWTFLAWGLINGLFFIPLLLSGTNRKNLDVVAQGGFIPNLKESFQMILTFGLICLTWIFFRAQNISEAFQYLTSIFYNVGKPIQFRFFNKITLSLILFMLLIDWLSREKGFDAYVGSIDSGLTRRLIYSALFLCIFFFGSFGKDSFIYFQF